VFNGKPLADSELLSLAGVEEEQTLYILGRLLGGGKKRKKKTYTKPKKQKHKHKKIKLRVLKFYKVSTAGSCLGPFGCDGSRARCLSSNALNSMDQLSSRDFSIHSIPLPLPLFPTTQYQPLSPPPPSQLISH